MERSSSCSRFRNRSRAVCAAAALAGAIATAGPGWAFGAGDAKLEIRGMTFVASREGAREVLLHADRAELQPVERQAQLQRVAARLLEPEGSGEFSLQCARAEVDLERSDFYAEGDVVGESDAGRRIEVAWVRYRHEEGLLYSDAPVSMREGGGSFRADGFRYHLRERRFELIGNVRAESAPASIPQPESSIPQPESSS